MVFLYWNISIVLSFCCVFLSAAGDAGKLPAPVNPVVSWRREFCPTLSWTRPNISDKCVVNYTISKQRGSEEVKSKTPYTSLAYGCQSREEDITFIITTVPNENCQGLTDSEPVQLIITRLQEVVKDFRCAYYASESLNCSWLPIPHITHLHSYYSFSDEHSGDVTDLQPCPFDLHGGSQLIGCHLNSSLVSPHRTVYFLINGSHGNTTITSTFYRVVKESFRPAAPEVSISLLESASPQLQISWSPPQYAPSQLHCFDHVLHYNACGEHKEHQYSSKQMASVPYNHKCKYSVWVQTRVNDHYCGTGESPPSPVQTYGSDSNADVVLTVVGISVCVFLSLCALLFCFFYKYKEKLLPKIPKPSLGKSFEGLMEPFYVPVSENVEGNLEVCPDNRQPPLAISSDLDTHMDNNTHTDSNTQTGNSTHTNSDTHTCRDTQDGNIPNTGSNTHTGDNTHTGENAHIGDDCAVVLDYSSVKG